MQLTGIRLADPVMARIHSVDDLVQQLKRPPPPRRLVDILRADPRLTALPNVEIFDRRQTPIDRETELGRWKVIEQELARRELPITGTPFSPHASAEAR